MLRENRIKNLLKDTLYPNLIREAVSYAEECYKDRKRKSGENYIEHALRVAQTLKEMGLDSKTIIAGLLHDTIDEL
ncbi:HD domain-containing protein, partial [Patescibacteria group bacterium]|nr:HD domain-containing protein [Patescibacteria group bacterium]